MEYGTFPIYLGSQEHTNEKGNPQRAHLFYFEFLHFQIYSKRPAFRPVLL